ncbi:MAG: hypothetical protein CFE45_09270 [Burkholderiales bacterium PBB5]|nr:MAG: hypothetical protein CFE45_09270 [Burkholderiales bacterium PBB5]
MAERLSPWLGWTDAIALAAVLPGPPAAAPGQLRAPALAGARAALAEHQRVRRMLLAAIDAALAPDGRPADPAVAKARSGARGRSAPVPKPVPVVDDAAADQAANPADPADYRRLYTAQQRAMDSAIGPLRAQLRTALAAQGPALAQLATLDAVLDQALAARERQVLGGVPALLDKHFRRLRQAPSASAGPAAWLARFGQDVQGVLRAELEIRLQPVAGMAAALAQNMRTEP